VQYRQLKVGAGVLAQRDGALLLLRRSQKSDAFPGSWSLPAGYCEADESPRATAVRETVEETSLQVAAGQLVDAYFFTDDPRGNGLLLVYEAEIHGGELEPNGDESVEAGFFLPQQLPTPLCGGGHDQAILAWQSRSRARWQPGSPMLFCPHCTHPLETKLAFDRVRPVCPACGFVHFRAPKVGVSVLVEAENRLLLVQRAVEPELGKWSLPSGFVEWDESPEAAAARECEEETGLLLAELSLADVRHYTDDFRGPGVNLTYRGRMAGGTLRPGDDAAEARFFAAGELPPDEQIAFQGHRLMLQRWQERSSDW
jgi:ADP-ribose pyrophosphatase YjhB (NUDIX family)